MSLAINVSDTVTTREGFKLEKPWHMRAGHSHKAAVSIYGGDEYYRDGARWTSIEHVWDRDHDVHVETRREKLTGDKIFQKQERASTRQPIDE